MGRGLLIVVVLAGLSGCGQRDAWLPPGELSETIEVELLHDAAVLRVTGAGHRTLDWRGGAWASAVPRDGKPPVELLRADGGARRRLSGPTGDEGLHDFRWVGDRLVFWRNVSGGRPVDELWQFDPETTLSSALPVHGVDGLWPRPGHTTVLVRGWSLSDSASALPDSAREVDPVSGRARTVAHLADHDYSQLVFDADGDWYFVPRKANKPPFKMSAVPLDGGPAVLSEWAQPVAARSVPVRGGLAIHGEGAIWLFLPPAEPVRLFTARAGDSVLEARSVLGGDGVAATVGLRLLDIDDTTPEEDTGTELVLVDVRTGAVRSLVDGFGMRWPEAASPDGRWLFERRRQRRFMQFPSREDIWVHDLLDASSPPRPLATPNTAVVGFSADSSKVLLFGGELVVLQSLEILAPLGDLVGLGGLGGGSGRLLPAAPTR